MQRSMRLQGAWLGWVLVTAILFFSATGAAAEEEWGYAISHELMSPFCPGRTLATCPSPQAAELVQWILVQEAGGATQQEVIDMLIERYGQDILGAPPAEGMTLWAYILPVVAFVVCGGVAFIVLRRIVRGGGFSTSGTSLSGDAGARAAATSASVPDGSARSDAGDETDLARIVDGDLEFRA